MILSDALAGNLQGSKASAQVGQTLSPGAFGSLTKMDSLTLNLHRSQTAIDSVWSPKVFNHLLITCTHGG